MAHRYFWDQVYIQLNTYRNQNNDFSSNPEDIEALKDALKGALYEQEEVKDYFKAAL